MHDYQVSAAAYGGRLANPGHELQQIAQSKEILDVVVVGSGYGGAITAARLAQRARPGSRIVVLERGREWLPGTFPDTFRNAAKELRFGLDFKGKRNRPRRQLGLYDLVFNDDIHVLSGNALGGTSVINANVAAMPDREVFEQCEWPNALRDREVLSPYYERAAWELNLQQVDELTYKSRRLQQIAQRTQCLEPATFYPADVSITYQGRGLDECGRNRQGFIQRPCTLCGDCTSGCNVGAKNTLQYNYLPIAKRHGAKMYAQTEVDFIQKTEAGYRIHFTQHSACGEEKHAQRNCIEARIVVLSAGSLGTTGILLRSRDCGFSLSRRVGHSFSGNGDTLGLVAGLEQRTHSAGFGAHCVEEAPVGAAQQRNFDLRHVAELKYRLLIQEGTVPRGYANIIGTLMGDPNVERTLIMLAVGHDGSRGRIELVDGQPRVRWPGPDLFREYSRARLKQLVERGGGRLKSSVGDTPVTVHPLGGCGMGDNPDCGVTSDMGLVFDPDSSSTSHQGLYVADGSLMPTSLGANPYFTIAAVSERIADGIGGSFPNLFQDA